jgi:carnitine monooxygenase subunit
VIDTTLREALDGGATLPADWYTSPDILRLELERIFSRSWQYAGRAELARDPGTYFATAAGHIPVAVVRGRDGELRAFVNVCRHRGHEVVSGCGRRETLQCPYHAWTYELDGSLRKAPRSEREPGFDPSGLSLLPVQVDTWGPFVFVNPDLDAPPLAEALGELPARVAESGVDLDALAFRERIDWELAANWKVGVENYLECYHCATAHPGFSKLIDVDPDAYRLQAEGLVASQYGPVRESARNGSRKGLAYVPEGEVVQAQYHLLFPNFTLNIEPGRANCSLDSWIPAGPGRTRGGTEYFFAPDVPEPVVRDMMAFSQQVGVEDNALVESVQRGLTSGMVQQGRLLPQSEQLIHHFQLLVYEALA